MDALIEAEIGQINRKMIRWTRRRLALAARPALTSKAQALKAGEEARLQHEFQGYLARLHALAAAGARGA